jgi:alpha-beta hydrolase superfamily lysophospholipase
MSRPSGGLEVTPYIHRWTADEPRCIVLIAHGYGEHAGRYSHVAEHLVDALDAAVWAPDHRGHGRTEEGERALVDDGEALTSDLHDVSDQARAEHPGLPVVLIGHSMGGLIATRYAQRYGDELSALVLSGPAIGGNPAFAQLLALDPIPDVPIDPAVLSRDPAVGEAYAADELVYHGPFARQTLEQLFAAVERVGGGGDLGNLPTLWIHGSDDQLVPLEVTREMIERIRGSNLQEHIYEGARHEVFNETNRDEVLADVTAFLREALAQVAAPARDAAT